MENMKLYHVIAKYLKEYKIVAKNIEGVIKTIEKLKEEEKEDIEISEIKILEENIIVCK